MPSERPQRILRTSTSTRPRTRRRPARGDLFGQARGPCPAPLLLPSQFYVEMERCRGLLLRKQAEGDAAGVAACYLQIGDLYLWRGEIEQAGEMYRKSLEISRLSGDRYRVAT